ncbi:hypothetical protein [Leeuwenhoekiella sp. NPDC079379]|uniref:hypothetical protein n=1 Tax=Leeuwenhoekiella sp. NPDC079379 TaxID=3364122 RepID=UPI0037CAE5E0
MIKLFIWLVHLVALSTMPQSALTTASGSFEKELLNELDTAVVYDSSEDCNNFKKKE